MSWVGWSEVSRGGMSRVSWLGVGVSGLGRVGQVVVVVAVGGGWKGVGGHTEVWPVTFASVHLCLPRWACGGVRTAGGMRDMLPRGMTSTHSRS